MNNHIEVKRLVQILNEAFGNELDEKWVQLNIKVAKQSKTSAILAPFIFTLSYENIKDHLPLIISQVRGPLNIVPLIEDIATKFTDDQEKVAELLYLILKQKFEPEAPSDEEQSKKESEVFVKRLTQIQDILVKKFNLETVVKVLERLIKNEKFFCKILISMILLMLKHNSAD